MLPLAARARGPRYDVAGDVVRDPDPLHWFALPGESAADRRRQAATVRRAGRDLERALAQTPRRRPRAMHPGPSVQFLRQSRPCDGCGERLSSGRDQVRLRSCIGPGYWLCVDCGLNDIVTEEVAMDLWAAREARCPGRPRAA